MAEKRSERDSAADFAAHCREMDAWVDGPWTTNFQQLLDRGIELPDPDTIDEANVSAKLWEVIDALADLRVFLDETDHLSDRELYAVLWRNTLRADAPDVPGPPSSAAWHVNLPGDDENSSLYLKYYADEAYRQDWLAQFPDDNMPAHEDPPHHRDWRLPTPYGLAPMEAREWLGDNRNQSAFATNRFGTTSAALDFVAHLYAAGASRVMIEHIAVLRAEDEGPYADAMTVFLPADPVRRSEVHRLIEASAQPDEREDRGTGSGEESVWLWWD